MIVNPFMEKDRLLPYSGTRILQDDFGLTGAVFMDPTDKQRAWTVQGLYTPLRYRTVQGIRTRVADSKGYVSFINQMDLEVLLGMARPGSNCRWTGRKYSEYGDHDFFGLCMDEEDLLDDLFDREQMLRGEYGNGLLPDNLQFVRRLHLEDFVDVEERLLLLWDGDSTTGMSPDFRSETITRRWSSVERYRAPYREAQ